MSCYGNLNRTTTNDDIIVYRNLDNTLLVYNSKMLFGKESALFDISIKHIKKPFYEKMLDTLNKYGVKQNSYTNPRPAYAFIAKNKKSDDTLYANVRMTEWWFIKDKNKLFIKDQNQKTFEFLSFYSNFF